MNTIDEAVKQMDIAAISGDFVSPYTLKERDFFVCAYGMSDGALVYSKGALLSHFGMEVPQQLAQLDDAVSLWPVVDEHREATRAYFASLPVNARQLTGAPSLFEMRVEAGEEKSWLCISAATLLRNGGQVLEIHIIRVDNEKRALASLMDRSQTDPLTHALNRDGLIHAMEKMNKRGRAYAFLMLDIDGFKHFNETYGHLAGDALLAGIVNKLMAGLEKEDLIARTGGDEFVICLCNSEENQYIQRAVRHVHNCVLGDKPEKLQLSVSMGVALSPKDGATFEELYQKADVAMLCAKQRGGDSYLFYEPDMALPKSDDDEIGHTEQNQQHYLIRYSPTSKSFAYPCELHNIFHACFNCRPLWDVLEEDGVARKTTVRQLKSALQDVEASEEPRVSFSEYLLKNHDGMWRWYRIGLVSTGKGSEIAITLTDVNDELHAARQLRHITEYDKLTGLFSHAAFVRQATRILEQDPEGVDNGQYALMYFDIFRFKAINDKFGSSEGDRLLMYIANGLLSLAMGDELVCRLSSDQFALLLHRSGENLQAFVDRYLHAIEDYDLGFEILSNVGVYVTSDRSLSTDAMLDRAILAQSKVKGNYVERYHYYSEDLRSAMLGEQEIVGMMNTALAEEQFVVYYQPQYDHSNGELVGAEALVRWKHPEHGLISPGVFIPIFEKNGFITKLDIYVFEQVCRYQRRCIDRGMPQIPISVNLTRYDIYQPGFIDQLEELRQRYQVPVELLCIEITETAVVGDNRHAMQVIGQLHQRGYVVEMDDFGSGYSSLNVLKDIDLDVLKLDMRFLSKDIQELEKNRGGTILSSVVRMAKWLRLPVIAEGVESIQQADYLKSIGCNYIQGFLYARPMPEAEFVDLLNRSTIGVAKPNMSLIDSMNAGRFWDPESQETLIFSHFVGGAAIFDYHGGRMEVLRVNPKYIQEIGADLSEKELIRSDPLPLFDVQSQQAYLDMLERAIASGNEETCETWRTYGKESPQRVCIRSTVRVIGTSNNSYLFYEMIRNVTTEKNALAEVMHREQIFRAASEQVNVYYWEYDVASREMLPCFRCMRDMGLPERVCNYPEPAIQMGIFPPEVAEQYREMHRRIEEGVKEQVADMPLTPDRVMFRVRYTTAFDENGKPIKAYGSAIPL